MVQDRTKSLDEGIVMSKFKVGERVVIARLCEHPISAKLYEVGSVQTVVRIYKSHSFPYLLEDEKALYNDEELEHEHIYNSPLYKALT